MIELVAYNSGRKESFHYIITVVDFLKFSLAEQKIFCPT